MTVIPAIRAGDLNPGDLYAVNCYGPYFVVKIDGGGVRALALKDGRQGGREDRVGGTFFVGRTGADKVRADSCRLEHSAIVPFKDVPPGVFFMASPQGFAKEEVFIMDLHGKVFLANGLPLEISFFPEETQVETFDLVTDLEIE